MNSDFLGPAMPAKLVLADYRNRRGRYRKVGQDLGYLHRELLPVEWPQIARHNDQRTGRQPL
jgi:hypothetical protein